MFGPQDLQLALEKVRSALLEREERLKEAEQEWRQRGEEQELTIRALRTSLLARDQRMEVRGASWRHFTSCNISHGPVAMAIVEFFSPDISLSSKDAKSMLKL